MASDPEVVVVSLQELQTDSISSSTLKDAFGASSLGILIVKDLPAKYGQLRLRLLTLASHLAQLPYEDLEILTKPEAHYNVGWSHGKEALQSGKYDTLKGSFYATVLSSHLASIFQGSDVEAHLEHPNVWPPFPEFQETLEELSTMIVDIAVLVARACDRFASNAAKGYQTGSLERIVKESMTHRARLLHYFPPVEGAQHEEEEDEAAEETWCTLHVDDGCLTGLTSALFIDESTSLPAPATASAFPPAASPKSPDPRAGLYIHSRDADVVKVDIPPDCIAFQTGSALELMAGGALRAVPHFVRGPSAGAGKWARNTLAVFTQPRWEEVVDARIGLTFGEHIRLSDEMHA